MANKKKTDLAAETDTVVNFGAVDINVSPEIANDTSNADVFANPAYVPSTLWYCVEDATGLGTLALNLPSGCLIMTILDQNKPALQYVQGIRYDEASKRFTV